MGIGQINDGGITLLDWAVDKGLRLMNTSFQKRKRRLIIFRSGETETTMNDYTLVNNKYRSSVNDVKVIPVGEVVRQHCLLLMDKVFK